MKNKTLGVLLILAFLLITWMLLCIDTPKHKTVQKTCKITSIEIEPRNTLSPEMETVYITECGKFFSLRTDYSVGDSLPITIVTFEKQK